MKGQKFVFLDIVVIILQVTYNVSLTRVVTFDLIPLPWNLTIFFFMLITYLLRFGPKFSFFELCSKYRFIYLLLLIYFMDFVQKFSIIKFVAFMDMCLFISYLYNLYKTNNYKIDKVENTYLAYCYYNLVVIVLAFLFILSGLLDPTSNELPVNSVTEDNVENNNFQEYSFPGYLSVALKDKRLFADFGVPLLTGLSHEPHVLSYLILPGLFLSMRKKYNSITKGIIITLYFAVILICFSSTAFFSLVAVLFVDFVWRVWVKKKYCTLILLIPIVYIVYNWGAFIVQAISEELLMKTVEQTGSMETSTSVLSYIVSPNGLLGSGNFQAEKHGETVGGNIGYVTCILDLFFYGLVMFFSLKNSLSKNSSIHYLGLACLYYFIHFLKVPFFSLEYPYFVFILFLFVISKDSTIPSLFMTKTKKKTKQKSVI